jgi:hypothetical protein
MKFGFHSHITCTSFHHRSTPLDGEVDSKATLFAQPYHHSQPLKPFRIVKKLYGIEPVQSDIDESLTL